MTINPGQVAATVAAALPGKQRVFTAQRGFGKGLARADMFPCILSSHQAGGIPLRELPGAVAATVVPLVGHLPTGEILCAAAVAVGGLAVVLLVARWVRQRLVRRQLARRVTYELLPSSSFDPAPEDVARFAHQIARTRPAVAWLRPRRGASVRIRLSTDDDGQLCYQVSGPASAGSVLRHQTYPQVELREAESPSPDVADGGHVTGEEE